MPQGIGTITKAIAKNILLALLIALVLIMPGVFSPSPAHASQKSDHTVYVIGGSQISWSNIDEENMPVLRSIAGRYAVANVATDGTNRVAELAATENVKYIDLDPTLTPREADMQIYEIYSNMLETDCLVVTGSTDFSESIYTVDGYAPLILKDARDAGYLTSVRTSRNDLVTSNDIYDAVISLAASYQKKAGNISSVSLSYLDDTDTRIATLTKTSEAAYSVVQSFEAFLLFAGMMLILACGSTIAFIFFRHSTNLRRKHYLARLTKISWTVMLSIPASAYMFIIWAPVGVTPLLSIFIFIASIIILTALTIALSYQFGDIWSTAILVGATIIIIIVDQMTGARLAAACYLSYSPIRCGRLFGIGNEGAALLMGAWLGLCSIIVSHIKNENIRRRLMKTAFPIISTFIILVVAAPWWGANFGILIWGIIAIGIAYGALVLKKVTPGYVTLIVLASGAIALTALYVDVTFNNGSHMSKLTFEPGTLIEQVIEEINLVVDYSWATIVEYPPLTCAFIAGVIFIIWLSVSKRPSIQRFWAEYPRSQLLYNTALIAAFISMVVEDSGIVMPALIMLYQLAVISWNACDYHDRQLENEDTGTQGKRTEHAIPRSPSGHSSKIHRRLSNTGNRGKTR